MLFGSDGLANFYLGCFLFGLIFTAVSLFLSAGNFGGGDAHAGDAGVGADGHGFDLGAGDSGVHAGDGHAAHDTGHAISWLNLPTILAFITWFGGAGYLLHASAGVPGVFSAAGAIMVGLVGAVIMFLLLARVLWPGQGRPMSRAEYRLRGTPARVASRIAAGGGTGEIVYVKGGVRSTIGARSDTGEAIERGSDVVVVRYERGLAYVVAVDAMLSKTTPLELPTENPTVPLREGAPPADKARG